MNEQPDRLLEAIDHPERFSDEELEQLLADPETRALYNIMCKSARALVEPVEPDVDREWNAFVGNNTGRRTLGFSRRVAVIAAICIFSLAAVATAFVLTTSVDFNTRTTEIEPIVTEQANTVSSEELPEVPTPAPEVVIFNGDALENIINTICTFYGASATFNNASAKDLRLYFRWNQADSLADVAEQLNNFEQIRIALNNNALTVE